MTDEEKPQDDLLTQLLSPKRSARVAAIVQLSRTSSDRSVLRKLREMASDSDREIALFASQAVTRIQARLGEQPTGGPAGGLLRDSLLVPIPAEVPKLLEMIRVGPSELPEDLRPAAAEFLGRFGKTQDSSILKEWLLGVTSNLAFPFLEALETLAPSEVAPLLPPLLASDQPLVRGRAVVALQRIDFEEALNHLSEMFVSRNPEARLAGVRDAFFFPFPRVREMAFALLAEETDPEVVTAVETLLASNPELDTAMRLLDLIDMVPPQLKKGLNRVFRTVTEIIGVVGILPKEEVEPKALLVRWQKERLHKFLADLEIKLMVADRPRRTAAEAWLAANMNIPEVATFVQRLSFNPATELLARKLAERKSERKIFVGSGPETLSPGGNRDSFSAKNELLSPSTSSSLPDTPDGRKSSAPSHAASTHVSTASFAESRTTDHETASSEEPQSSDARVTEAGELGEGRKSAEEEKSGKSEHSGKDKKKILQSVPRPIHPRDLSPDEKRWWLWKVEPAEAGQWGAWIRGEALRGEGNIRLAALVALSKFPPSADDAQIAEAALDSNDASLQAAGFKLLERCNRSKLAKRLSVLLTVESPSVRALAVRFGFTIDEQAAIATLGKMLQSVDPTQRAQATASLFFAPIEQVRRLLLQTLEKETNPDIARQILTVLQSNPSQETLDALDNVQRTPSPAVGMLIAQARIDLFDMLLQLDLDRPTEVAGKKKISPHKEKGSHQEAKGAERGGSGKTTHDGSAVSNKSKKGSGGSAESSAPSPSKGKSVSQMPSVSSASSASSVLPISSVSPASSTQSAKPYAVSEMREQLRRREVAWRSPILPDSPGGSSYGSVFGNFKPVLVVGLLIAVLAFAPLLFLRPPVPADTSGMNPAGAVDTPRIDGGIREGFTMGRVCRVQAKVEKLSEDGTLRLSVSGKTIVTRFNASFPTLIGGEDVTVEFLPYRKLKNGEILAEGHSLKSK
ncbi:MAG: hypothetical protein WA705_08590 [Candidatus Ozemobacteraceae bacterium]